MTQYLLNRQAFSLFEGEGAKRAKDGKQQKQPFCFESKKIFAFLSGLGVLAVIFMGNPVSAAFLDFSVPAREAALGGNGVALPEGTSSLIFNPAGLGDHSRFDVSARYENLFSGLDGDNLSTGNLSAVFPLWWGDAFGLSVDHFGGNNLSQDRILAAFGKSFDAKSTLRNLRFGISLSYVWQQFTLSAPLAGVNPANVSAGNFSVGAGVLYDPVPWATLGLSLDDLNQPNLGVIGTDLVPAFLRYGVSVRPRVGKENRLTLTLDQSLSGTVWDTQGGAEWTFTRLGMALRAGCDGHSAIVGVGWRTNGLTIDYAYEFSWYGAPSLGGVGLPGSHLLEVGFSWENTSRVVEPSSNLVEPSSNLVEPSSNLSETQKDQARLWLQEGLKAYVNGDVDTAVADWEQVLKIDPHNVNALNNLARVRMEREEGGSNP